MARSTLAENYNKIMKVLKTTLGNEMEEEVFSSEKITFKKKRNLFIGDNTPYYGSNNLDYLPLK